MLSGLSFQGRGNFGKLDGDYENGTRALDDHRYEDAVRRFDAVIDGKSPRADGALYWKAYALNRVGRRDDALAALTALRRDYPNSRWLNEAQALEAEVKQGSGQAVSPTQETNEDLKLMAINSLMGADPDRAMPLLEGLLKGNGTPKEKDRAMFVLTQNRSQRAQQILAEYAKGAGNPDLQMRAIRYIGMSGTNDGRQQLVSIYNGSNDAGVKRQVIQSLLISNGREPLFTIAKNEKDEELRRDAIRQLGAMGASDQLLQLYASATSADNKIAILRSLAISGSASFGGNAHAPVRIGERSDGEESGDRRALCARRCKSPDRPGTEGKRYDDEEVHGGAAVADAQQGSYGLHDGAAEMKILVTAFLATVCVWAQQPQVENAKVEARTLAGSLATDLSSRGAGPFWAAWSEPMIPGRQGDMCWSNGGNWNEHATGAPVRLEGQTSLVVLVRMENAQVDQIRVATFDCRFDGGGLPFYWLNAVPPAESVNWLKAEVEGARGNAFGLRDTCDQPAVGTRGRSGA